MSLPREEIAALSVYLEGFADGTTLLPPGAARGSRYIKLLNASNWLDQLSRHICGAGFIGCNGGDNCSSDHK